MKTPEWRWFDKVGVAVGGGLIGAMVLIVVWAAWQALWPTSRWYELRSVTVSPARMGEVVRLTIDRTVHQGFTGEYATTVTDIASGTPICAGGDRVLYEAGRPLPDAVTLSWWTEGAEPPCQGELKAGLFRLRTCVEVLHGVPFVGRREVCANSNVFPVWADAG